MAKEEVKKMAIELRKEGFSYKEISEKLGISKGSCSLWLSKVVLNESAKKRIARLGLDGRNRGYTTIRQKRVVRDQVISSQVIADMQKINITPEIGKLLCAMLYWAEGEKNTTAVNFMNSDPAMITTYLWFLRTHFNAQPEKFRAQLHLHSYHNVKKQKQYWSKLTEIPENMITVYEKENSGKNIKIGYPGCISIRYYDVRLAREIKYYYNALIDKIGVSVNGKPQLSKS